jgi:hypothetical protein
MKDEIDARITNAEINAKTNVSIDYIKNIMSTLNYTAEQAMDLLKIPQENRSRYMSKL